MGYPWFPLFPSVGVDDGAETEVDVDEEMNEELTTDPERVLQTTPVLAKPPAERLRSTRR